MPWFLGGAGLLSPCRGPGPQDSWLVWLPARKACLTPAGSFGHHREAAIVSVSQALWCFVAKYNPFFCF